MRSRIWGICVLLAFTMAVRAQSGGGEGWSTYSNDAGKFSIMLPAAPAEGSTTEKGVLLHTFQVVQKPRIYMVLYSDYPDADLTLETATRLKLEKDGFLRGLSGSLVSEREFKFKRGATELPAMDFTAETNSAIYKCVVVIDSHRVYFIGAGSIKGNDSTKEFERFLGSFSLK